MLHNWKGGYEISPYFWWRVCVGLGGYHRSLRVVEYSAAQEGRGSIRNRPGCKQKSLDGSPLGLPCAILPPGDRPWKMNKGNEEETKSYLISIEAIT